jgi:hypothetical protein
MIWPACAAQQCVQLPGSCQDQTQTCCLSVLHCPSAVAAAVAVAAAAMSWPVTASDALGCVLLCLTQQRPLLLLQARPASRLVASQKRRIQHVLLLLLLLRDPCFCQDPCCLQHAADLLHGYQQQQ